MAGVAICPAVKADRVGGGRVGLRQSRVVSGIAERDCNAIKGTTSARASGRRLARSGIDAACDRPHWQSDDAGEEATGRCGRGWAWVWLVGGGCVRCGFNLDVLASSPSLEGSACFALDVAAGATMTERVLKT